jgi:[ribosomal protein S5]-alanine N-acetyltransferase
LTFFLLELSTSDLETIAASRIPSLFAPRAEQGAMPPDFVAARALELAKAGHPPPWSSAFLIVNEADGRIVGSCGFKTAPVQGQVEVGYGVAEVARGNGAATAALQSLVSRAFDAGATSVLAEVAPTNHASTRVVLKAGFKNTGSRVDDDNEVVVQWCKRSDD